MLRSLRARIAGVFILGGLTPLLLTNIVLINTLREHSERALERRLTSINAHGRGFIEHHLEGLERLAEGLARVPWMSEALVAEAATPPWLRATLGLTPPPSTLALSSLLAAQEAHWGQIHHAMLADQSGRVRLSPGHLGSAKSHTGQQLPADLLGPGFTAPRMTGFFGFEEAEHFHALIAVPVRRPNGEVIGAVALEVDIGHILSRLAQGAQEGVEITLSTPEGQRVVEEKRAALPPVKHLGLEAAKASPVTVAGRFTSRGEPVFGVYHADLERGWILAVETPIEALDVLARGAWLKGLALIGCGLILIAGVGLWLGRRFSAPIRALVKIAEAVSRGDLTARSDYQSKSEIGHLTAALNHSVQEMHRLASGIYASSSRIGEISKQLKEDATSLEDASQSVTVEANEVLTSISVLKEARDQSERAANLIKDEAIAAARFAETVIQNTAELGQRAVEISQDMQQLAAAIDEMAATSEQIARIGTNASKASESSKARAQATLEEMRQLNDSALKIGQSVDLVEKLASRSTLLALNASIEAASAGEAGRGFAVVAKEVKALAGQTSEAVEQIGALVEAIQGAAAHTERSVKASATEADALDLLIGQLAVAVSEQSSTTQEMAETVAMSVQRSQDVAHTASALQVSAGQAGLIASTAHEVVAQAQALGGVLAEVHARVDKVSVSAKGSAARATHVEETAHALSARAEEMRALSARFKL
ncbi:methyl-accepting chemotaxis protein [Myxococcota bacterium]|nr:methyl-accepting chemotaxis protein [Myxococcota bacterium]MBU1896950.1 methyl-accepting chemotaxis protein [Myxococcota bacterium]